MWLIKAAVGRERRAAIAVNPTGGVHREQAPMTAGRIVPIVLGCSLPTEIERAVCLRDVALDALFMFIRFTDASRPGGRRAAMSYMVAVPEVLAAAGDVARIGSALSADGQGGLVGCQEVRQRGGRQIMTTYDESD